jgi:phosphoserine aminotransferase
MTKIFFTPGPSQLYLTVAKHLEKGLIENVYSISHRGKQFEQIFAETTANLKKLLNIPEDYSIFFVSSGTECMERIIENCVEKYSFHFVNGAFSQRFYETAIELKKQPLEQKADLGSGFDFENVSIPLKTELICFVHNETSTGVMLNSKKIESFKKLFPETLIAVDCVSSMPYVDLNYKAVDLVFFSVQKLLGLPAGLGVLIVSPNALKKAESLSKRKINIGTYHNLLSLQKYASKNQTPETPSVMHIYLLEKVLEDMLKIGIKKIRNDTDKKAKLIYDFLDNDPYLSSFVKDEQFRSKTVIVAKMDQKTESLIKFLKERGIVVAGGYGALKDFQIRIANVPANSINNTKLLIKSLRLYTKQLKP